MAERRYSEEEVKEIFDRATKAQVGERRQLPSGEGMTLSALQDIGKEVGVPPELVAEAARALDQGGRVTTRKLLGMTIGVGRTADLGRKLSDAEWERMVVELRTMFDATGRVKQDGAFRQWSNGNLQVLVEPTVTGHQVRMRTIKSQSVGLIGGGLALLGVSVAMAMSLFFAGKLTADKATSGLFLVMAMGVGVFSWGALMLPAWVKERRQQMEELVRRLTARTE